MRGRAWHFNLERTGTIARNRKVCDIPRPQHTAIRPGGKSVSAADDFKYASHGIWATERAQSA
jgi:hypothetical protein